MKLMVAQFCRGSPPGGRRFLQSKLGNYVFPYALL
jgi:hypothetical protein